MNKNAVFNVSVDMPVLEELLRLISEDTNVNRWDDFISANAEVLIEALATINVETLLSDNSNEVED
jgi:hypothetical protein